MRDYTVGRDPPKGISSGSVGGPRRVMGISPSSDRRSRTAGQMRIVERSELCGSNSVTARHAGGGAKARHPRGDCAFCQLRGIKRGETVWFCEHCNVHLHPECFLDYHVQVKGFFGEVERVARPR